MKSNLADENGYFIIKNLRPGTYNVGIQDWPDDGPDPMHAIVKMAIAARSRQEVQIEDGGVSRVDLRLADTQTPPRSLPGVMGLHERSR